MHAFEAAWNKLQVVTFDYNKEDENPVEFVRFYRKDNYHKALKVTECVVGSLIQFIILQF